MGGDLLPTDDPHSISCILHALFQLQEDEVFNMQGRSAHENDWQVATLLGFDASMLNKYDDLSLLPQKGQKVPTRLAFHLLVEPLHRHPEIVFPRIAVL